MNADVAIVGGGVIGTAVAWFLARSDLKVVLVERGAIAAGTSGRCDGNVLLIDKMPGFDCRFARLSQELVPDVASRLDVDVEWTQKGSLLVIESEEELAVARDFCGKLADEGLPVRILDRQEVHEDEPHLAENIVGGMEAMCDGSLNPMALAQGLARDAKKRGAIILTGAEATEIRRDSRGRVESLETDGGRIKTPRVVNAAGIYAPEIGRFVGVQIPIRPRQGQILVSERTFQVARRKVMEFGYLMAKFGGGDYKRDVDSDMEEFGVAFVFEPTRAGNFLIGSSRRFVGENLASDRRLLAALARRAIRFFPMIETINVIRSYTGLRPYTPDHFPIISETPVPGFFIAAGHEGDGISLSLITGKLMSQIILGQPTEIEVDRLSLNRFREGVIGDKKGDQ